MFAWAGKTNYLIALSACGKVINVLFWTKLFPYKEGTEFCKLSPIANHNSDNK